MLAQSITHERSAGTPAPSLPILLMPMIMPASFSEDLLEILHLLFRFSLPHKAFPIPGFHLPHLPFCPHLPPQPPPTPLQLCSCALMMVLQEPTTAPASFSEELLEMLNLLGVHISVSQRVWTHLCRLLRHQIRFYSHQANTGIDPDAISKLEAVSSHLLPLTSLLGQ